LRVPCLHRRALVGCGEGREHRVAGADLLEVALHDLGLVALGAAAEVASHRIDRLAAPRAQELGGAATVLVGERRPGEVDAPHGRTVRGMNERSTEFVALGHAGSEHYAGIETFANPGVSRVELTSDELVAMCPITNQPDMYVATIDYEPDALCIESKSLKLYLAGFRNEGAFCEALAVRIRDDAAQALELAPEKVHVTLRQKARGGITIVAQT
jgi:7-cyano-7-deazaguanine reductase